MTTIATRVIAKKFKGSLLNTLKESAFSLSLDEASDSFGKSYLGICAKYLKQYEDQPRIQTSYITLIELDETGKTGQAIFNKLHDELLWDPKIANNFLGISTD